MLHQFWISVGQICQRCYTRYPRRFIFIGLLLIYALFAGPRLLKPSSNNHFAYLAQSFLQGQTHLSIPAPHHNDWASYWKLTLQPSINSTQVPSPFKGIRLRKGRHQWQHLNGKSYTILPQSILKKEKKTYVSFPPLPALLLLPFVALFGLNASDVLLTLFFAALNGVLLFNLLTRLNESLHLKRSSADQVWLILLLTLGSAHFWCSVSGQVWFTALIIGVSFQLLFLRFAYQMSSPIWAGVMLGCAFATRASLILYALFFYAQIFFPLTPTPPPLKERLRKALLFSIPPLIIGLSLLSYNWIRFESWTEFGHRYLAEGQIARIQTYGLFHPVFLKKNLISAFLLLPKLQETFPYIRVSWHGMSIPFSIPVLLWIPLLWFLVLRFLSLKRLDSHLESRPDSQNVSTSLFSPPSFWNLQHLHLIGLCTFLIGLLLSLLLLYQNTGWVQYSYRFILDFIPLCILLLACWPSSFPKLFKFLILWSIVLHGIGAGAFGRAFFTPFFVNLPILYPH